MSDGHLAENDARLVAIREASTHSLIPGSTARYVSMRDVERAFAERVEDDVLLRIKVVLDAHQFNGGGPGRDASCYADGCEWTHPWDRPTHEMWDVHRAHVAGQITSVVSPASGDAKQRRGGRRER